MNEEQEEALNRFWNEFKRPFEWVADRMANWNPWVQWVVSVVFVLVILVLIIWSDMAIPAAAPQGVVPIPHPEMWRFP